MGMRARRSRAAFLSMTIPTCNQIGSSIERAVRFIAAVAVAFYVAGEACGRAMYQLSDWLVDLTNRPVDTILGLVPTKPKPEPDSTPVLQLLGAQLLSNSELEEEIKTYEKKRKPRPARRRKPKVTKVEARGSDPRRLDFCNLGLPPTSRTRFLFLLICLNLFF